MTSTERMTRVGAELMVDALLELGVEVAFGLPGVHNLPLWKALSRSPVRLVGVRHEQAAAYAADGYARATGRLGVALVTTGPGAANTLGAVGEAMASGSPVLVIATDIPSRLRRPGVYRGVLHETRDQAAMFAPVTRASWRVEDAAALGSEVVRAGSRALEAPSGPVYLGVPTDLLSTAVDYPEERHNEPQMRPVCDVRSLEAAVELINDASRPLVWAGGGALRADAGAAVGALAVKLAAPVVTTYMGRGLIRPDHPCFVPGPVHLPEVARLWDEADLVIAIGSDFDGMMTQNWAMPAPPRLLTINIDPDDAAKNYTPTLSLAGDATELSDALAQRLDPRPGLQELTTRLSELAAEIRAVVTGDEPQALEFLDTIHAVVPEDAVVVADMCIPGYWLGGFYRVPAARKLQYPVGWGTLGFALPATLGAALAGRGRPICVCGDGGFLFACGELATAAQERLPMTIVLVDDGGYGMLRFDQTHAGDTQFGVDLHTPDFVALAGSFGIPATRVSGFGDAFAAALSSSLEVAGPVMVVVDAALKPPPTTSPRWYRRAPMKGATS